MSAKATQIVDCPHTKNFIAQANGLALALSAGAKALPFCRGGVDTGRNRAAAALGIRGYGVGARISRNPWGEGVP